MSSAKNFSKAKSGIDGGVSITFTNLPAKCRRRPPSWYARHAAPTGRRWATSLPKRVSKAQTILKQNSLAFDVCTAAEEKIADSGRIIVAVVAGGESEKDLADRREMSLQIAQQKIPFRRCPAFLRRMVKIEIDRERSDPI